MGIKQLSKLLKENCMKGIRERPLSYYSSKSVAVDASMSLYQFLIAVRSEGAMLGVGEAATSHLVGIFYRTIKMVELGILPVYVFDGAPPELKMKELEKRSERRLAADKDYKEAEEAGDKEKMDMHSKRKAKVSSVHVDECKKLLKLMRIPFEDAPSEAEAHCAFLCKKGAVYGVATEDMDALTFGTPVLLRNFFGSNAKKHLVTEYNLELLMKELSLEKSEFIDLCILLGCDYCEGIKGVGPKRALALIREHRNIENIIENERLDVCNDWGYKEARKMFEDLAEAGDTSKYSIDWDAIDREGIVEFLVNQRGFDSIRVNRAVDKLLNSKGKGTQGRLDLFLRGSK
ncbi:flap endonuclease 1 [Ordospora colligata]|uniref:Flap endonuclease 1 n=1 Tax=Ordospora colligata OC4 TaxID=1354746 RepID=A0A0B2UM78_9MICR|nr:flap endonuclease 1 [Ordospora colligata OC4]KHN70080.1 flap endonuclease 1 [Ordospora colligata OC4]TBU16462.1 flap endonuclease 1 [Ordospora colligata]TBU16647.1 flap endonuclease 1 [Ordospora colligata]TBU19220.1 flap endonuclease 1 [Ordospora colligata]